MTKPPQNHFHIHMVSDSTGETLIKLAKSVAALFETTTAIEHSYALVRTSKDLGPALQEIKRTPGVVMFTLVNPALRQELETHCQALEVPCLAILDPLISTLQNYLGQNISHKAGSQHSLDADYFHRIDAMNFALKHDDGQNIKTLPQAEIILVGPSRTSKTPTCIYLAYRGVRAGNVPLVPDIEPPAMLAAAKDILIVGLTASVGRLLQVRKNRISEHDGLDESFYTDHRVISDEITKAKRLYAKYNWPVIDVTRSSIEETSAAIFNLHTHWKENGGQKS